MWIQWERRCAKNAMRVLCRLGRLAALCRLGRLSATLGVRPGCGAAPPAARERIRMVANVCFVPRGLRRKSRAPSRAATSVRIRLQDRSCVRRRLRDAAGGAILTILLESAKSVLRGSTLMKETGANFVHQATLRITPGLLHACGAQREGMMGGAALEPSSALQWQCAYFNENIL